MLSAPSGRTSPQPTTVLTPLGGLERGGGEDLSPTSPIELRPPTKEVVAGSALVDRRPLPFRFGDRGHGAAHWSRTPSGTAQGAVDTSLQGCGLAGSRQAQPRYGDSVVGVNRTGRSRASPGVAHSKQGPEGRVDQTLEMFASSQHGRVVGLLTLHVGDRHVAHELAQEAMVRLCQHWHRVKDMDEPQAWLTTVALNLATSRFRRRAAERRAVTRSGPAAQVVEPDTAGALTVRQALQSLPPRQRTVLVLRFLEDLSVMETARLMNCAEGTVKSLTSKGVAALRENANLSPHHLLEECESAG